MMCFPPGRTALLFLWLAAGSTACADPADPAVATLSFTTSTSGEDPDPDGYRLTVDDADTVHLHPSDSTSVSVAPGQHVLNLLGVADQCTVAPVSPVDIEVAPGSTTLVNFDITCTHTGVQITTMTEGIDADPNGYMVIIEGEERAAIDVDASVFVPTGEGSLTIGLTGLASNCQFSGPPSRAVTVVTGQVSPVDFSLVCAATSGVIRIDLEVEGDGPGGYSATVDGSVQVAIQPGRSSFVEPVTGGQHVVQLSHPSGCSVPDGHARLVAVTVGTTVRDTVEVRYLVICPAGTLRVTAPTTGPVPQQPYRVSICYIADYCYYPWVWDSLGALEPNGLLLASPRPGSYWLELGNLPEKCAVDGFNPRSIEIPRDSVVEFAVVCSP
jgi:hypothetical protein